jgi:hypothetical protein
MKWACPNRKIEGKSVIVPIDMKDRFIRHKVRGTINHLTALTWVAVRGDALCFVIVALRKVPANSYHRGRRLGKDFYIQRNSKLDIDRSFFSVSFVIDLTRT